MHLGQWSHRKAAERKQWFQPNHWLIWAAIAIILPGGVGLFALSLLLNNPEFSGCVISATATASVRLSCAQETADKQTVDDLLSAIALIKAIPSDDPLHPAVERSVKQWSIDILAQGEAAFQQGNLEQAIAIAHQIPVNASTNKLVSDRIKLWQSSWSKADAIAKDAEAKIQQNNWQQAYSKAVKLLNIGNRYWQTTKYKQLMESIDTVQKDSEEQQETEEVAYLDKARNLALSDDIDGITAAIKEAVRIKSDSPRYDQAQHLVSGWRSRLETIQNCSYLDQADQLAIKDDVGSLQTAVTEASQIRSSCALYKEAQQKIPQWKAQIQTLKDRSHPHAKKPANRGHVGSLQAVVKEASRIARGRGLHNAAREQTQ